MKRDSTGALERVQQAIAASEVRLAELGKQHEAALESDDSIDQARAIARQMEEERGDLAELHGRREKLEARLVVEREEQDRKDYQVEVDETVARLPRRKAAAKAIEKALRDLAGGTKEFIAESAAVGLPTTPLSVLIRDTFAPDRGLMGRRHPPDYLELAREAWGRGFVEAVEEEHVEHENYLRHAHDPRPSEDETEPEAQADENEEAVA